LYVLTNTLCFYYLPRVLTYNVVGHIKTITILVLGILMFEDNFVLDDKRVWNIIGIVVALFGAVAYGHFKTRPK